MSPALIVRRLRSEIAGPFELTLAIGSRDAITGPSGSGKSFFLRMIADLDPNEGEVWLNDRERASLRPRLGESWSPMSARNPAGGPTGSSNIFRPLHGAWLLPWQTVLAFAPMSSAHPFINCLP